MADEDEDNNDNNLDRIQMEAELVETEKKAADLRAKLGDNKKIMKRSRWDALEPARQAEFLQAGGTVVD